MNYSKAIGEVRIGIKDLFFFCLLRWRVLIIWLVIGAILGAGFGIIRNKKAQESGINREESDLKGALSDEKAAVCESIAESLTNYVYLYEDQINLINNSAFQKLDPYAIKTIELKFLVKPEQGEEDTSKNSALVQAYAAAVSGDNLEAVLAKEFPDDKDLYYLYENTVVVDTELQGQGIFVVSVYNDDEETLNKVANAVKESIQNKKSDVSTSIGDNQISLISETRLVKSDMKIYYMQLLNLKNLDIIKENIEKIKEDILDSEYAYIEHLVYKNCDSPYINIAIDASKKSTGNGIVFSKKWTLLGAIAGVIIALICIIIKYIISGKLRNSIDIEEEVGIQLISTFDDESTTKKGHKTKLDKALRAARIGRKGRSFDANVDLVTTKLAMAAERMGLKKICVAVGTDVEADTSFMDDVTKACDKAEIVVAHDITQNAEAIRIMTDVDGLVILEQMDKSKYSHIASALQLCESYGVNVIGAIVIE